ncbi:MAG TPA: SCP2 sterol-binding domain-containing protein [Steroidobacteraceae bacterium]|nr:SCP2 sterol-binding domain-containing protein [Steroidobacteraceae bacterium]
MGSSTLLRSAAAVLPRALLGRLANGIVRGLGRTHPRLIANLAALEPAVVHITPLDLPYCFTLRIGCSPLTLQIVDHGPNGADAGVAASAATFLDLLEGRIDGDALFFRRDLAICGNSSVIVGLRNVMDREQLCLADEIAALLGPLGAPARALARRCDPILDRIGARAAAWHRGLHPPSAAAVDATAELDRCRGEIAALTARLAKLEARERRRAEKAA